MASQFFNNQRGGFNYVTAILLLLVAVGIVAGIWIAPKYLKAGKLKRELYANMVKAAKISDREIESAVAKWADEQDIPLSLEQVKCYREGKQIHCGYEFDWPAGIPGLSNYKLHFTESIEREITKVMPKLSQPK